MNAKQRRVELKHRKKKMRYRARRREQAQTTGATRPAVRRTTT